MLMLHILEKTMGVSANPTSNFTPSWRINAIHTNKSVGIHTVQAQPIDPTACNVCNRQMVWLDDMDEAVWLQVMCIHPLMLQ